MPSAETWPWFAVNNFELTRFDRLEAELAPIGAKKLWKAGSRLKWQLMLIPELKQFPQSAKATLKYQQTNKLFIPLSIFYYRVDNIGGITFKIIYHLHYRTLKYKIWHLLS